MFAEKIVLFFFYRNDHVTDKRLYISARKLNISQDCHTDNDIKLLHKHFPSSAALRHTVHNPKLDFFQGENLYQNQEKERTCLPKSSKSSFSALRYRKTRTSTNNRQVTASSQYLKRQHRLKSFHHKVLMLDGKYERIALKKTKSFGFLQES